MPQRWDAQGNPVSDTPPPPSGQRWDANGNPVGVFHPANEPTEEQLGVHQGAVPAGSYQNRKGGPILNAGDSPVHSATQAALGAFGIKDADTLGDAAKQAGTAFGGMAKDSFGNWKKALGGNEPMEKYLPLASVGAALMTPFDMAAKGIEGVASGIESGSSDIEQGIKRGDPRSIASGIGGLSGLKMQMAGPEAIDEGLKAKISASEKLIHRNLAIDKGKVSVVNDMLRKPLAMLNERIMGPNGEISQSVNSVLSADEMDMQSKGNQTGFVDVSKAAGAARDVMGKTMKALPEGAEGQILRAESRPMIPLREAKSFTTDVGRDAAALERAGKFREAAALNALYDGLHKATGDRAQELGTQQANR